MRTLMIFCIFLCVLFLVRSDDSEAQPECSGNEEFDRCYAHCEEKCGENKRCNSKCTPGCRCIYGFAREKSGKCIKHSDCPCGENEKFHDCRSHCNQKCEDPHGSFPCNDICVPGCKCADGYGKDKNKKCVKLSECPGYVTCPHDNESYKKSFYYCGETCQNATRIDCGENKFKNGCVCDNGFLRDEVAGGCISEEKCKNGTQEKQAK